MRRQSGIGPFEKHLSVWVLLCMAAGILIGKYMPAGPALLGKLEYAHTSLPIAALIWVMIYPMMLKVDLAGHDGRGFDRGPGHAPAGALYKQNPHWFPEKGGAL